MGICWYCYWGWPEKVASIYDEALIRLNGDELPLHFGPSHIVWEDENFNRAEWCLEHFDDYSENLSEEEYDIVKWSLEELIKIPIEERDIEPEDYDGINPQNYPPKIKTVKR